MFLKALPGFHCFTGCDSISAFAGRGKIKPLKILIRKKEYIEAFGELGMNWNVSEETQSVLESFVCHMYGKKDALKLGISVNDLRYDIYCRKSGKVSCEGLPPCLNVLSQHIKRANYQTKIWRMCLDPLVERCDPSEHGWGKDDGGLFVKWMTCNPALDEVNKDIIVPRFMIVETNLNLGKPKSFVQETLRLLKKFNLIFRYSHL